MNKCVWVTVRAGASEDGLRGQAGYRAVLGGADRQRAPRQRARGRGRGIGSAGHSDWLVALPSAREGPLGTIPSAPPPPFPQVCAGVFFCAA